MGDKDIVSKEIIGKLAAYLAIYLLDLPIDPDFQEAMGTEHQRIEDRRADLVVKLRDRGGEPFLLHIEIQNDNDPKMPVRMMRYPTDVLLAYPGLPVHQHLIYIGAEQSTMSDRFEGYDSYHRYGLVDMRAVDACHYRSSCAIIQGIEILRQYVAMTCRRFAITAQRLSLELKDILLGEFQESPLEVIFELTNCLVAIIAIETYGIRIAPFRSPADIDIVFLPPVYIGHLGQSGVDDARFDPSFFDISDKVPVCIPIIEYDGVGNPLFYLFFVYSQ